MRLTTSDTGAALSSIDYDPWGAVERGTVARFGFTGELQQGSSVHLRARWYNASSGSFASVDPYAGDPASPASLAPYMYAYNQPTGFTDPSGRCILGIVIDTIVCAAIGYTLLAGGLALGVYATAKAVECAQQSCLVPPVQNLINSFQPSAPPSTDTGTKDDTTLVLMPEGNNEGPGEPPSGLGRGAKIAAGITAGLIVASSIPIPPCATDTTSDAQDSHFYFRDVGPYNAPGRNTNNIIADLQTYHYIQGIQGQISQLNNAQTQSNTVPWRKYQLMGRKFEAERTIYYARMGMLSRANSTAKYFDLQVNGFGTINYIEVKWSVGPIPDKTINNVVQESKAHLPLTYLLESNNIDNRARQKLQQKGGIEIP